MAACPQRVVFVENESAHRRTSVTFSKIARLVGSHHFHELHASNTVASTENAMLRNPQSRRDRSFRFEVAFRPTRQHPLRFL